MSSSRIKKTMRGIVFGGVNKVITILFPFVVRTILIKKLGAEYAGLSNLFGSIIGALSLSELGFGGIIVYFLYKPLADNDMFTVSGIINYYKKIYRAVGGFIGGVGLLLTPFLSHFIRGTYPSDINIYVIYLIMLFNTVVSYLMFSYKAALLTASHRQDIDSIIASIISCTTYILQILSLLFIRNFYAYIIITPVMTVTTNLVCSNTVNRLFPELDHKAEISKELKYSIKKKVIDALGFRIDTVVLASSDSIIISAFLGLTLLTKYNNYLYITTSLFGIINIIIQSIKPGIGNSIVLESVEKNEKNMHQITFLFAWILGWCSVCLLCLYQDFMQIWLGKEFLLPLSTVVLLVIYFYECKMIEAINMYKDSLGYWSVDRIRPYLESAFNLIVNIILVKTIGLNGVILSTVLANLLFAYPSIIVVMHKKYFNSSAASYFLLLARYTVINAILIAAMYSLCSLIQLQPILALPIKASLCVVLPNLVFNFLYRKKEEYSYFKTVCHGILKKKGLQK